MTAPARAGRRPDAAAWPHRAANLMPPRHRRARASGRHALRGVRRSSIAIQQFQSTIRNQQSALHAFILWPSAPFRRYPVDDLIRVHDVARLAVDAVGRIDLEFLRAVARIDHFVDVRGTETRAGIAVLFAAPRAADV